MSTLLKRLEAFDKNAPGPQERCTASLCHEAANEIRRLTQALKDVADPIEHIRRTLPPGYTIDGAAAQAFASDPECLRELARKALSEHSSKGGE